MWTIPPPPLPEFYQPSDQDKRYSDRRHDKTASQGTLESNNAYGTTSISESYKSLDYHICRICLRPRSGRYHREHPIPANGVPLPPGICQRCRVVEVKEVDNRNKSNVRKPSAVNRSEEQPEEPAVDEPSELRQTQKSKPHTLPTEDPLVAESSSTKHTPAPIEQAIPFSATDNRVCEEDGDNMWHNQTQAIPVQIHPPICWYIQPQPWAPFHASHPSSFPAEPPQQNLQPIAAKSTNSEHNVDETTMRRIVREEVRFYRQAERKLAAHPDPYAHGGMYPVVRNASIRQSAYAERSLSALKGADPTDRAVDTVRQSTQERSERSEIATIEKIAEVGLQGNGKSEDRSLRSRSHVLNDVTDIYQWEMSSEEAKGAVQRQSTTPLLNLESTLVRTQSSQPQMTDSPTWVQIAEAEQELSQETGGIDHGSMSGQTSTTHCRAQTSSQSLSYHNHPDQWPTEEVERDTTIRKSDKWTVPSSERKLHAAISKDGHDTPEPVSRFIRPSRTSDSHDHECSASRKPFPSHNNDPGQCGATTSKTTVNPSSFVDNQPASYMRDSCASNHRAPSKMESREHDSARSMAKISAASTADYLYIDRQREERYRAKHAYSRPDTYQEAERLLVRDSVAQNHGRVTDLKNNSDQFVDDTSSRVRFSDIVGIAPAPLVASESSPDVTPMKIQRQSDRLSRTRQNKIPVSLPGPSSRGRSPVQQPKSDDIRSRDLPYRRASVRDESCEGQSGRSASDKSKASRSSRRSPVSSLREYVTQQQHIKHTEPVDGYGPFVEEGRRSASREAWDGSMRSESSSERNVRRRKQRSPLW